jgi:2-polyprenyl-6-methoxyphenol hydroxylase-like FAD-dependent oxidoreductase
MSIEPWRLSELTSFPYLVEIPQWKVEAIIANLLSEKNISVYRPFRAVDLKMVEDSASQWKFNVRFDDGQSILAKYVIGADGARSTVRRHPKRA